MGGNTLEIRIGLTAHRANIVFFQKEASFFLSFFKAARTHKAYARETRKARENFFRVFRVFRGQDNCANSELICKAAF